METPQNQISHDENMRRLESKMKNVEWSAPPNPIDKTGEEAKRLGIPVPPKPSHTPGPWIVAGSFPASICGGADHEVCIAVIESDGGYEAPDEEQRANALLIAAAPETAAERDALKLKLRSADKEIDRLKLVNQMLDESEDCAHLREVNAELLAAIKKCLSATYEGTHEDGVNSVRSIACSAIAKASV